MYNTKSEVKEKIRAHSASAFMAVMRISPSYCPGG